MIKNNILFFQIKSNFVKSKFKSLDVSLYKTSDDEVKTHNLSGFSKSVKADLVRLYDEASTDETVYQKVIIFNDYKQDKTYIDILKEKADEETTIVSVECFTFPVRDDQSLVGLIKDGLVQVKASPQSNVVEVDKTDTGLVLVSTNGNSTFDFTKEESKNDFHKVISVFLRTGLKVTTKNYLEILETYYKAFPDSIFEESLITALIDKEKIKNALSVASSVKFARSLKENMNGQNLEYFKYLRTAKDIRYGATDIQADREICIANEKVNIFILRLKQVMNLKETLNIDSLECYTYFKEENSDFNELYKSCKKLLSQEYSNLLTNKNKKQDMNQFTTGGSNGEFRNYEQASFNTGDFSIKQLLTYSDFLNNLFPIDPILEDAVLMNLNVLIENYLSIMTIPVEKGKQLLEMELDLEKTENEIHYAVKKPLLTKYLSLDTKSDKESYLVYLVDKEERFCISSLIELEKKRDNLKSKIEMFKKNI